MQIYQHARPKQTLQRHQLYKHKPTVTAFIQILLLEQLRFKLTSKNKNKPGDH